VPELRAYGLQLKASAPRREASQLASQSASQQSSHMLAWD